MASRERADRRGCGGLLRGRNVAGLGRALLDLLLLDPAHGGAEFLAGLFERVGGLGLADGDRDSLPMGCMVLLTLRGRGERRFLIRITPRPGDGGATGSRRPRRTAPSTPVQVQRRRHT